VKILSCDLAEAVPTPVLKKFLDAYCRTDTLYTGPAGVPPPDQPVIEIVQDRTKYWERQIAAMGLRKKFVEHRIPPFSPIGDGKNFTTDACNL
jgi:hypothetical protein